MSDATLEAETDEVNITTSDLLLGDLIDGLEMERVRKAYYSMSLKEIDHRFVPYDGTLPNPGYAVDVSIDVRPGYEQSRSGFMQFNSVKDPNLLTQSHRDLLEIDRKIKEWFTQRGIAIQQEPQQPTGSNYSISNKNSLRFIF